LEIVQALNNMEMCRSRFGQLIEATRTKLENFPVWRVSHTRREANEAAHLLAKAAISMSLDCVWKDSYPEFLHRIVLVEQDSI
jgi:hypothetical protein